MPARLHPPQTDAEAPLRTLAAVLLAVLLGAAALFGATPVHAAGSTDLVVALTGPQKVTGSTSETFELVVRNVGGPSAADGAEVVVSTSGLTSLASVKCLYTSPLPCGDATISGNRVTLDRWPVGGEFRFTVVATFGYVAAGQSASASVSAEVQPPTGVTDTNPKSNQASVGQTVSPTATLKVAIAMEGPTVASLGEPLTRRVTVSNRGDATRVHVRLWRSDNFNGLAVDWRMSCESAEGAACPPDSAWTPSGTDPGTVQLGHMDSGAVVVLNFTAVYTQKQCSHSDSTYVRLYADALVDDSRQNLDTSRASSEAKLLGLERCPTVDLTVDVQAPESLDLSTDSRYESTVTYTNNGARTEPASLTRRIHDYSYAFEYSDETLSCSAVGMSCPEPVTDAFTTDIPSGASLTLRYTALVRQTRCTNYGSSTLSHEGSINYAGSESKQNVGNPSSERVATVVSGLNQCIQRQVKTRIELPAPAWLGEPVTVREFFTNNSTERASFRMSDDRILDFSFQGVAVASSSARCLSELCPPEYPAGETTDVGAQAGAMTGGSVTWMDAGAEIAIEKTVIFKPSANRCPANGELSVRFDLSISAATVGEVGRDDSFDYYTLKCKDDTIAVSVADAEPGAATTLSVEVGNAGGLRRDQPVEIALPRDGIFVDAAQLADMVCAQAGDAVECPRVTHDEATHTLRLSFSGVGTAETVLARIPVTLGVKPRVGGVSYPVVAQVGEGHGEVSPSSNRSLTNVAIANTAVPVGLQVRREGSAATAEVSLRAVMSCRFQGDFTYNGVLPADQASVTLPALDVYPGDTCSLRIDDADGATWVSGQVQGERGVDGPFSWLAVLQATSGVSPTPSGPEVSPTPSGPEVSPTPSGPEVSPTPSGPEVSPTPSASEPVPTTPTLDEGTTPSSSEYVSGPPRTDSPSLPGTGSTPRTDGTPAITVPADATRSAPGDSAPSTDHAEHAPSSPAEVAEPASPASNSSAKSSSSTATGEDLSQTGTSVQPLVVLALLAVVAGGAALALTRRQAKH